MHCSQHPHSTRVLYTHKNQLALNSSTQCKSTTLQLHCCQVTTAVKVNRGGGSFITAPLFSSNDSQQKSPKNSRRKRITRWVQGKTTSCYYKTIVTTNLSSPPVDTKYQASSQRVKNLEAHLQCLCGTIKQNNATKNNTCCLQMFKVTPRTGEITGLSDSAWLYYINAGGGKAADWAVKTREQLAMTVPETLIPSLREVWYYKADKKISAKLSCKHKEQ